MTIRKFSMLLYTLDDVMNYEARKLGMMTGMVSFKEEQEHWIYKKEKDMYGDSYVSPEEIKDELGKNIKKIKITKIKKREKNMANYFIGSVGTAEAFKVENGKNGNSIYF